MLLVNYTVAYLLEWRMELEEQNWILVIRWYCILMRFTIVSFAIVLSWRSLLFQVGPQAIYVVGRDDDESIATGSEANDDAGSWETVEDDDSESVENSKQVSGSWNYGFHAPH